MPEATPTLPRPSGTVLVVDDYDANRRLLERLLVRHHYRVMLAAGGVDALAAVAQDPPDVVLTDLRMPNGDGFELCRAMKASAATRLIPIVIMTGAMESGDRIRAIEAGADDFLTKPIDQAELAARLRSLVRVKHFTDDLDSAEAVLRSLALTIEARDAYTIGHCDRLASYAADLGHALGLSHDDIITLTRGGYFHDLGKIALPDAILLKRGPLTREEFLKVQEHPVVGERLCGDLRSLRLVRPIVRMHHERLDGSGYPDGLKGDAISLLAQIIGIVDAYDAMTSDRPYRKALAAHEACGQLVAEVKAGRMRGDLVDAFVAIRTAQPTARLSARDAGRESRASGAA
jgi:putative two-component system response regulator